MASKVAVVTGAARGLGRAIALSLALDFTVVVHYRHSRDEALRVLAAIKKRSPKSIVVSGDLTDEEVVAAMFAQIIQKLGRVDLLVNNVGNFLYKKFNQTSSSEFRDLIESNLYSTLFCSRAVLPAMRRQKSGHIVNIGVVGAESIQLREKAIPYFLAKNGVWVLTKVMAAEEAQYGIHVNMISPASLAVDIFRPADFPMGRPTKYEDVTGVLRFLISDDAYYINGANIEVAGAFVPGMR